MGVDKKLVLYSPLEPDECASRLTLAIGEDRPFMFFGGCSKEVLGSVRGMRFRIRKRIGYRNDFQWHFSGEMTRHVNGTRIEGTFGARPWVAVFMFIWFTGVLLIGSVIFLITLAHLIFGWFEFKGNGPAWLGIVVPPVILFFGTTISRFGRMANVDFLKRFLIETLAATPEKTVE